MRFAVFCDLKSFSVKSSHKVNFLPMRSNHGGNSPPTLQYGCPGGGSHPEIGEEVAPDHSPSFQNAGRNDPLKNAR